MTLDLKDLRDSEEERGEPQIFTFLCQHTGVTATQVLTCPPILNRHYAVMMQSGLRIADTLEGGGVEGCPPTHAFIPPP